MTSFVVKVVTMETLYFASDDRDFIARLEQELKRIFKPKESIAVKLHMGEKENPNHLKPEFVKIVVDILKKIDAKPFLFDSPVMYNSRRNTVEGYKKQCDEIGFSESVVGCPVVVSNDFIEVKGRHMKYQVCRHLAEADGVLVLTHFKGHVCSGIGGSIKNLGMGALTSKSKTDIHEGSMPRLVGECISCGKCLEVCPVKCVSYSEGKACFNLASCYGCSKCIQNCPQKCLSPSVAEFDYLLADGAAAALKTFKKSYFVNVMRNITDLCDCSSRGAKIILDDIGILMGRDIVAIDKTSLDMANKKAGRQIFNEIWHKDSGLHIREAERLGMGNMGYVLNDD